jgi:hypothetical protein
VLGWSPAEFWEASLHDLLPAVDGFNECRGGRKPRDDAETAGAAFAAALRRHKAA